MSDKTLASQPIPMYQGLVNDQQTSVRLPALLMRQLDEYRKRFPGANLSRGAVIRMLLVQALEVERGERDR